MTKMILDRKCLICGKPMNIEIDDKTKEILTRGVFFTRMEIPTKDAKVIKKYKDEELKINNEPITVVEHDNTRKWNTGYVHSSLHLKFSIFLPWNGKLFILFLL